MERLTTKNNVGINVFKMGYECDSCSNLIWRLPDIIGEGSPTDKLAYYEDLEERLVKTYGECDELLKTIVDSLEKNHELSKPLFKSKLLIEEDVDKWEQLKERDTAKKPIKTTEETGIRYTYSYRCPNCGGNFMGTGIADFCYHCGQRLDFGGLDEI